MKTEQKMWLENSKAVTGPGCSWTACWQCSHWCQTSPNHGSNPANHGSKPLHCHPTSSITSLHQKCPAHKCGPPIPGIWSQSYTCTRGWKRLGHGLHISILPEPDNHWLLNLYDEAMTWPDLWGEPIEKEMKNMRDRNVWKIIENLPPDICWYDRYMARHDFAWFSRI